jgi:hypothetical protein
MNFFILWRYAQLFSYTIPLLYASSQSAVNACYFEMLSCFWSILICIYSIYTDTFLNFLGILCNTSAECRAFDF